KRKFAAAPKRKTVDGTDRWLAHRFQQMHDALTVERKLFPVHRSLLGKFGNIRACNKGLFSHTGQDEHADTYIVARVEQSAMQLFDGLPVQRVQHFRTIERDGGNAVFLVVENVLVAHRRHRSTRTSSLWDWPDRCNRKSRGRIFCHSSRPPPCA